MDDSRPVLVLSNPSDVTADVVLRLLADRRVPVVRLDPGTDLHAGASLTAAYRADDLRGILRTASRAIDITRTRSVWTRRPSAYEGPQALSDQDRRFAAEQALWGAGGILSSLPCAHYVNHPWNNRAAEFKPAQLSAAQRCGFVLPSTVITNDPNEARSFVDDQPGGVVYKPLWNTSYRVDGRPHSVWVRTVYAEEITDAVSVCPHMFQAEVVKEFDARVTAVGGQLLGVRIDSPDLDWRRRQDVMVCSPLEVPAPVARAVAAYLAEFRLIYGAFDFAVTPAGVWNFLECNPNGQWAWQPPEITGAIARAIADQLEKGPDT